MWHFLKGGDIKNNALQLGLHHGPWCTVTVVAAHQTQYCSTAPQLDNYNPKGQLQNLISGKYS